MLYAQWLKQPRCPVRGEWVSKPGCMHTKEYYLAMKRKELTNQKRLWMNLKRMFLSERSQSQKATYCMTPIIGHTGKEKKTSDELKQKQKQQQWLTQLEGRREG